MSSVSSRKAAGVSTLALEEKTPLGISAGEGLQAPVEAYDPAQAKGSAERVGGQRAVVAKVRMLYVNVH